LIEASQAKITTKTVAARDLLAEIRQISIFQQVKDEDLDCIGEVELVEAPAGTVLVNPGETNIHFWVILEGEIRMTKPEADGGNSLLIPFKAGDTFGEVPLLTGASATVVRCEALVDSRLMRLTGTSFWGLLGTCPVVRAGVLANMGRRLEAYQAITLHREKLISLGTLAAGLMHELNNPGAAARRAAAQLRENMTRLQMISLRFAQASLTADQLRCMADLQQEALKFQKPQAMSTLDQADAEEELLNWLESTGVENAWKVAPTLVCVGWTRQDIECAQHAFPPEVLSDALNWL
jgi:CRP-like cAMP-binding protein